MKLFSFQFNIFNVHAIFWKVFPDFALSAVKLTLPEIRVPGTLFTVSQILTRRDDQASQLYKDYFRKLITGVFMLFKMLNFACVSSIAIVFLISTIYCALENNQTKLRLLTNIWNSLENWEFDIPPELSRECSKSVVQWKNGIVSGEPWALQMLDASAKIAPGLLEGNVVFMGALEECWSVRSPIESPNPFQGSYYMLVLSSNRNKAQAQKLVNDIRHIFQFSAEQILKIFVRKFQYDVCIPSTCSKNDLQIILSAVSDGFLNKYGLRLIAQDQAHEQVEYSPSIIFALSVFAILFLFITVGTAADVFYRNYDNYHKGSRCRDILVSFSVVTNSLRLFDQKRSTNALPFLDGIRALSSIMVLFGHVDILVVKTVVGNYPEYEILYNSPLNLIFFVYLATSTDTFFFTSGFVLCLSMKSLIQGTTKTISKIRAIAWRYYRLTPPFALCILFAILWPLLGSGPRWHLPCSYAVLSTFVHCDELWWPNLLYVINHFPVVCETCFVQGWSSAVDMQLFAISLFVVIPFIRSPRHVLGICFLLIASSWISHGYLAYVHNINPLFITAAILRSTQMKLLLFTSTSGRFGPYFIGFLTGFVLVKNWKTDVLKKHRFWISCIGLLCITSVGIDLPIFYRRSIFNNALSRAIWSIVRRSVWSLGLSCIFYACANGIGGIVNEFLSSTKFMLISKLSYMSYLTHVMLFHAYYGTTRGAIYVNVINIVVLHLGLTVCAYIVAFFAHLCFEAPFVSLGHILFSVKRGESKMIETEKRAAIEKGDKKTS